MLTPEHYAAIPRRPMDLSDYTEMLKRNWGWVVGPMLAGIAIASVVAFLLPNTYVSQASLRITPAQIAENILPSVVNQQMADRINQMQQDILSRTSLSELITRFDLYKRERQRKPLDDVIEHMKAKDVKIQVLNIAGQSHPASAFSIAFSYSDRYKSRDVVENLVNRFMESNLAGQRVAGSITSDFLHDEVQQAKTDLDKLNNDLTEFRKQNIGRLPEQAQVNVQALTSLQSQRASLDEALNRDSQEKIILESKLDTLRSQKDTYGSLTQSNADDPAQVVKSERLRDLNKIINDTEVQLAAKKEVYTESHPDVRSLEGQLVSLKKQRDQVEKDEEKQSAAAAASAKAGTSKRTNSFLTAQLNNLELMADQTRSQLKALEMDRSAKMKEVERLNREVSQFQGRLESGPANEQRYVQLMSDQQQANSRYQELLKKKELADQNQQAQARKAGENLEVLDPASLPTSPTAPNRPLIVGVGLVLSVMFGCAFIALREIKDTSLKNLKDVRAYTQLPILGSIPILENSIVVEGRRRLAAVSWFAAVLVCMAAVIGSMCYHYFLLRS